MAEDWTDVLLDYWAKGMNGTKTEAQKDFVTAVTAESSLSYQQVKIYFLPLESKQIVNYLTYSRPTLTVLWASVDCISIMT